MLLLFFIGISLFNELFSIMITKQMIVPIFILIITVIAIYQLASYLCKYVINHMEVKKKIK
ncbi:MAG: hypothetical protein ACLUD1_12240 [Clostridia bacterium]